ncbi:iron transporter Smf3p [[Candida] jaroonii]|uniref:Iron transporter Smf3p n=1 Tax=[Candida] jaroonii TaxID=467808 RepID=A0ACA9Y7Q9_9ASCO|nr:iron transporter Smf3p [[Candida] jaroonii]
MSVVGPGFMVSVAYIDPGNYSTAVAAGSAFQYKLLFSILLSNCLAVFLQVLSARLGCVTGLDLATNCKRNLNPKVNLFIYAMAEIAIIATDIAEVVGMAISLNILFNIPLLLGVIITISDVLVVLMAYRPNGPMLFVRIFELFVSILVIATVACFAIELYQVSHDSNINFDLGKVFEGFLPNEKVIDMSDREGGNGLFLSLAILGATVMPHSLYLGSGIVQSRLKEFDIKFGYYKVTEHEETDEENSQLVNEQEEEQEEEENEYRPSIHAINDTMSYTLTELVISLFTVALFVNSAILIVAGATLDQKHKRDHHEDDDNDGYMSDSDNEDYENADLFTIYHLLTKHLSPTAGLVFALALLFSGQSAGIICTLAGQMISEGFLSWNFPPVTRRIITRGLAIVPCLLVVTFSGREGLSNILNFSQVILSILLPIVTAPLIMFTCSKQIMRVPVFNELDDNEFNENKNKSSMTESIKLQDLNFQQSLASQQSSTFDCSNFEDLNSCSTIEHLMEARTVTERNANQVNSKSERDDKYYKDLSNGPITSFFAVLVWGFITSLNLFLIGSLVLGYDIPI